MSFDEQVFLAGNKDASHISQALILFLKWIGQTEADN